MKKYLLLICAVCLIATLALAADSSYTTKFYVQQGGDRAVVADGGEIDIESGGSLKIAGTAITATAAQLNNAVAGTFAVSSKIFIAGEDWTLSATEAKSVLLTLSSGSGTPSIVDAFSSGGAIKIVRNAANIAVTLKMSGQTGVSVGSGKTAVLINSGTDYVRVTADATH